MGRGLSCVASQDHVLFESIQLGDFEAFKSRVERDPSLLSQTTYDGQFLVHVASSNGQIETTYDGQFLLHVAASNGQIEVLSFLLERSVDPNVVNHHKQTPLMMAEMHGKIACLKKLHEARQMGYAQLVNIRDGRGATPLHLAAYQRQPECVHLLLDNGAFACTSTGGFGTPLHLVARGESLDCIHEFLAWGADCLQRDHSSYTTKQALNQESKVLLECALIKPTRERAKNILKTTAFALAPPSNIDVAADDSISEACDKELCCICFEHVCTIEVQGCGLQMCAQCTLALCCNKPKPTTACLAMTLIRKSEMY